MTKLLDDPNNIADNLQIYIAGFSESARDIIEKFEFSTQIEKLDRANLLYLVVSRFCAIDLHPDNVSNPGRGRSEERGRSGDLDDSGLDHGLAVGIVGLETVGHGAVAL